MPLARLSDLYHRDARQQGPGTSAAGIMEIEELLEARLQHWGHFKMVFLDQNSSDAGITYLKWDLHLNTKHGSLKLRGATQLQHDERILYQEDFYNPADLQPTHDGHLAALRSRLGGWGAAR